VGEVRDNFICGETEHQFVGGTNLFVGGTNLFPTCPSNRSNTKLENVECWKKSNIIRV